MTRTDYNVTIVKVVGETIASYNLTSNVTYEDLCISGHNLPKFLEEAQTKGFRIVIVTPRDAPF
jgi:hypothetical protein